MREIPLISTPPAHVPAALVVDFDAYDPPGVHRDFFQAWKALQAPGVPELVWTVRNGGHWIPTSGRLVAAIYGDWDRFSNRISLVPKETAGEGFFAIPVSLDPPEHGPFRALLNSVLGARTINRLEAEIRALAVSLIESVRLAGECDFTKRYAEELPIRIFMHLVDLPLEDSDTLKTINEHIIRPDGTISVVDATAQLHAYLRGPIEQRLGSDGDDMFSRMINGRVNGRALTVDEAVLLATTVLQGGIDTASNLLSFVMLFLATNPGHRRQLEADPSLVPAAVDEMLRRFPVVASGRVVRRDMTYEGVTMKAGEALILPTMLHGLDERENDRPLDVDFHRTERQYSTFGHAPHRCPGAHLARLELTITLEEWLGRIPDFELASQDIRFRGGVIGTVDALPLRWDVGSTRSGSDPGT